MSRSVFTISRTEEPSSTVTMGSTELLIMCFLSVVTSSDLSSSKIDCNDGGFYIRADPDNCSNFYVCDHGNPVLFTCDEGLYFNPALYVCDWKENVQCDIADGDNNDQNTGNNGRPSTTEGQQSNYANGGAPDDNSLNEDQNQEQTDQDSYLQDYHW